MKHKDNIFALNFLFLLYCVLLFWILFISTESKDRNNFYKISYSYFIPFKHTKEVFKLAKKYHFKNGTGYAIITNIIGNIFLFIPLGIYISLIFENYYFKEIAVVSFLISCFIEFTQHTFNVGVFDIDDIIYNCLGGGVGFLITYTSKKKS
jgi:glycopeptide antibiotics resistance protein